MARTSHHTQEAGHDPQLTSGTHSVQGRQGAGLKETTYLPPLQPGVKLGTSQLLGKCANHCTIKLQCVHICQVRYTELDMVSCLNSCMSMHVFMHEHTCVSNKASVFFCYLLILMVSDTKINLTDSFH